MDYTPLDKKAKKVMVLTAVIQAVAFSAVVLGVLYWFIGEGKIIISAAIAAAVIALLWVTAMPLVRFKRYRYMITPDRIEVIEGVFWIKRTVVPIDRVHQISVSKGPIDSAFGVAKVQVITAGSTAVMRFLNEEKANEIAMYLNSKVNEKLGGSSDVQ